MENFKKLHLENACGFLLFLFWALAPNIKGAANASLFLFFIFSAFFWREIKNNSLRHWAFLISLPFLLTLIQKIFIFPDLDIKHLDAPLRFLLAGACMFLFYKVNAQKLSTALFGIILGAIGLSIWAYITTRYPAFYSDWPFGEGHQRAWNMFTNPIAYGVLSVIFAMMTISLPSALFPKIPKNIFWTIKIVACFAGIYAAFLSFSRTALLVFPFLAFILIIKDFEKSKKITLFLTVIATLLIGSIFIVDNPFQDRFWSTFEEIQSFQKNNPVTSTGQRFFWWQHAIDIIQQNPLFGIGKSGFEAEMLRRLNEDVVLDGLPLTLFNNYTFSPHPVNDYLNFAVEFGVLGFALAFLLYFAPLAFFIKRLRSNDLIIQTSATCGTIIVTAFAVGGLVECLFSIINQITFYSLSVALFVAMILQIENQQNSQKNSALTVEN